MLAILNSAAVNTGVHMSFCIIVFFYFFTLISEEGFLSLLAILWNSAFKWVLQMVPKAQDGGCNSAGAAERNYPMSKVKSSSCALLEQL